MAIKDELIKLNTTKQGIKTVLQEKGVEVAGKSFTDTPALIGQMSVGKGDEVEAFALGEAKHAQVGGKVILNTAADMLPGEQIVEHSTGYESGKANTAPYIDKQVLYAGYGSPYTSASCFLCFKRNEEGFYKPTSTEFFNSGGMFIPYGLYNKSGTFYILKEGVIMSNYSTTYGGSSMSLCFDSEYKYATIGGHTPAIFELIDGSWSLLSKPLQMGTYIEGIGIISNYLLNQNTNNTLTTSTFDKNGVVTRLGTTTNTLGEYFGLWRMFDNNTKTIIANRYSSYSTPDGLKNLVIANLSFDGSLYSAAKNNELTTLLQGYITNAGINPVENVMIVDDKDIYIWGRKGIVVLRYENNTLTPIATPFPDLDWNNNFFINPVDKIAVLSKDLITRYIRELDAPIVQKYIATKPGMGLQFQSVSLSGFVKENKSGILKVTTVLDPNAIVPTYRDTYGLGVDVENGGPDEPYFINKDVNIIDKVASGFSSSAFIEVPITLPPQGNVSTMEIVVNATTGTSLTSNNPLFCRADNTDRGLYIQSSSGKIGWYTGSSFIGNTILQPNTKYWFGIRQGGGSGNQPFDLYMLLDDGTYTIDTLPQLGSSEWTSEFSGTVPNIISNYKFVIGKNTGTNLYWTGSVDLSNCKLIADGEVIWTPYRFYEGHIDISWGWFKSGNDYVKWSGTPSATLANIEGNKATKMGLWLVKDGDATKPVISTLEPTSYTARHKVDDVYLSDTLDYFLPKPYGLETSIQYGYTRRVFEQPVLAANGTPGGDYPACSASSTESSYEAWKAFDGKTSTYWGSSSSAVPDWLCFYNPQPLKVTAVDMTFTAEVYSAGTIQGSNDNITWDDIGSFTQNTSQTVSVPCTTTQFYKYVRVYFTAVANPWGKVISMNIIATLPFYAGSITLTEGWQEYDTVRYFLNQTTTKKFDEVIEGEKATTMGLWLVKDGAVTKSVISVSEPTSYAASHKVQDVYLSNDLTYLIYVDPAIEATVSQTIAQIESKGGIGVVFPTADLSDRNDTLTFANPGLKKNIKYIVKREFSTAETLSEGFAIAYWWRDESTGETGLGGNLFYFDDHQTDFEGYNIKKPDTGGYFTLTTTSTITALDLYLYVLDSDGKPTSRYDTTALKNKKEVWAFYPYDALYPTTKSEVKNV